MNGFINELLFSWATSSLSNLFAEAPLLSATSSLTPYLCFMVWQLVELLQHKQQHRILELTWKDKALLFAPTSLWKIRVVGFISQPSTYLMIGVDMMMWILIMTIVANSEVSYLDFLWFIEHSQGDHVNKPFPLQMDLSKHAMYPKLQLRMRKHLTKPCTFHRNFGEKTAKLWGPEHWGNSII